MKHATNLKKSRYIVCSKIIPKKTFTFQPVTVFCPLNNTKP